MGNSFIINTTTSSIVYKQWVLGEVIVILNYETMNDQLWGPCKHNIQLFAFNLDADTQQCDEEGYT